MEKASSILRHTLCALVLMTVAATGAAADPPASCGDSDYRLGVNDTIHLSIDDSADLSGDYQVESTGFVRLPRIGLVNAEGLSVHELENSIATVLKNGSHDGPRVAIEITTNRPFYVVGEVLKPGEYPFARDTSASSAVALAGGYTSKAVRGVVFIRHRGDRVERRLAAAPTTPIRPGDVIRVESIAVGDANDTPSALAGVSALRYTCP